MFEDGFRIFEGVFALEECESIGSRLASLGNGHKAGVRHLMSDPVFAGLAYDGRLLSICEEATGAPMLPYKAMLFNKTGKANWLVPWHQDTVLPIETEIVSQDWGPFSRKDGVIFGHAPFDALSKIVALRIHLDDSNSENGPLRAIPGSHRKKIERETELEDVVAVGPQLELTVGPGGVIAMSPLLVHASSKCISKESRRVLHIEYAPRMELTPGVRLAIA